MKFAKIKLNRKDGPVFTHKNGISKEEENNILVFALPTGEAKNGAFKLIMLNYNFYISYIELDQNNNGKAAVIGFNVKEENVKFNPIAFFEKLKLIANSEDIPPEEEFKDLGAEVTEPYSRQLKGGEFIMSSLFLLGRLVVVGTHEQIIQFLGSIYQAAPLDSIPYLSCVSLVNSITDSINIQGVEPTEEIMKELDDVKFNSTIVMLDQNEAFGTMSSPFTKNIADLYLQGKFEESSKQVREFISLALDGKITSSSDFAKKHGLHVTDAKLLKQLQERMEELKELRKENVYYKGVN